MTSEMHIIDMARLDQIMTIFLDKDGWFVSRHLLLYYNIYEIKTQDIRWND